MLDSIYASYSNLPEHEQFQEWVKFVPKVGSYAFDYTIIKAPSRDLILYHDYIGSIDYQYQEKPPLFHWQITPAKQVVAGYECQQAYTAFGGRVFEAWFTREIPVSEGPYKFYGLPGLIVKVRDTHDNYVFELLNFKSDLAPLIVIPTSPVSMGPSMSAAIIKKAKFKHAKLNDDLTFTDHMAASGNIIPEGMRNDYLAKLKRRNNPLELK